jgi:hypothetical protein
VSLELIYTSAAKGLKPGTRGFCTVAMTQGMPPQLADRLESLSGYRQVFGPQDPQAALNPVVQSHLRLSVAGRNYHILSRICAAGLDYSQRANKFAYHLVLDASELPPAGPAWAILQSGLMKTAWNGAPQFLPAGPRCPAANVAPAFCRTWQQVTGDAGWGGALAESAVEKPKNPVTIIFRPGLDPLPLIAESLALLPAELRWNVTFSTYHTKLPPGVECNWRCVLQGSPESKGTTGLVIDLCHPLAAAQGGALVVASRSGKVPASPVPASSGAPDERELELLLEPVDLRAPRGDEWIPAPISAPIAAIEPLPPQLPDGVSLSPSISTRLPRRKPRLKQPARWPLIAAVVVGVLILAGGGGVLLLARKDTNDAGRTSTEPVKDGRKEVDAELAKKHEIERLHDAHAERAALRQSFLISEGLVAFHLGQAKVAKLKIKEGIPKAIEIWADVVVNVEEAHRTIQRIREARKTEEKLQVALADLPSTASLPPKTAFSRAEKRAWPILMRSLPEVDYELGLIGGDFLTGGYRLFLRDRPRNEISQFWDLNLSLLSKSGTKLQESRIGDFSLDQGKLQFRWDDRTAKPPMADQLANCVLRVSAKQSSIVESKAIALRNAITLPPIEFAAVLNNGEARLSFRLDPLPAQKDAVPSAELYLVGRDSQSHSIKTLGGTDTIIVDNLIKLRLLTGWDELVVEYVGVPLNWSLPEENLLARVIRKSPEPTQVKRAQVKRFIEFVNERCKAIEKRKKELEEEKRDAIEAQKKVDLTSEITKQVAEIHEREAERKDAESLLGILDGLASLQLGYRITFAVAGDDRNYNVDLVRAGDAQATGR